MSPSQRRLLARGSIVGSHDLVLVSAQVHGELLPAVEGLGAEVAAEAHLPVVALLVGDEGRQVGEGARTVAALEAAPLARLPVAQVAAAAFQHRGVLWSTQRSSFVRNRHQIAPQKTGGCRGPPQGCGWAEGKRLDEQCRKPNRPVDVHLRSAKTDRTKQKEKRTTTCSAFLSP